MNDSGSYCVSYAWKKQIVWNGRFLFACCIAVDGSGKKNETAWVYVKMLTYIFLFKTVLIKLSEKIYSYWWTIMLAMKSCVTQEKIWQLKWEILKLYDLLARIDCARWLFLFYFGLSLWCVIILMRLCVCVHGFNCAHLPAPPSPLVQHQAKAGAEPGSVWRVLSLCYSWTFSSTSGNNLWITRVYSH